MDLTYSNLADEDCFRKVDIITDVELSSKESVGNTLVKDWPLLDVGILRVWRQTVNYGESLELAC